jgi:hypothetical protein
VIAETIPEAYDSTGRQVSQPFLRRKGPHPTFPMGRYVSQSLALQCKTIEDIQKFLRGCRGVSDKELFGKEDYWQPPEEFEERKAGDCEDFSLWTWRQMLSMGRDARLVFGKHGRYGIGHAWVVFFEDSKCFLVEPQARYLGLRLPRLSTLAYQPKFSVAWNGEALKYYAHKDDSDFHPRWSFFITLVPEWTRIWGWFWFRFAVRLPYRVVRKLWPKARAKPANASTLRTR